ncbi:hypothetical protein LCGC14_0921730 [marine sediment metagenome]|uniref:Uncharacterized protein n=1 Tax=marine sediment metagenome TaxID=412755 RepID=A0A0F9RXA9_9ZZZZ
MVAWLLILQGVANVMEVITFVQFIEEEAIQSASLGVFLAIRGKSYRGASLGMTLLRGTLIPHLKDINLAVGWMAPYSQGCFADFILATETNLDIYEELLFAHK